MSCVPLRPRLGLDCVDKLGKACYSDRRFVEDGSSVEPIDLYKGGRTMAHKILADECIACGSCAEECPEEAISEHESGDYYVIDAAKCTDCGTCAEVCPVEAAVPA